MLLGYPAPLQLRLSGLETSTRIVRYGYGIDVLLFTEAVVYSIIETHHLAVQQKFQNTKSMVVKEAERRRTHHSSSPSMSASASSGSPDAEHDHQKRKQRRRRRPSGSEILDDMDDPSSSSKQIRVRSRDRGRHRDRERGRDTEHRHRSSTLPDLGIPGLTAADDDPNGDKPWFKKKTLWASVATMVSTVSFSSLPLLGGFR